MKRILIRPSWEPWLDNRMFIGAEGCVYTSAFALWKARAADAGFQLDTWDKLPLQAADCVWMMDLPRRKSQFEEVKKKAGSNVPFVLQVLESPVVTPQSFVERNRRHFDAVVSYEPGLNESLKQFSYYLPNNTQVTTAEVPFHERRCAVMVNSNRVEGIFAVRQPGIEGLPGIGRYLSGWELPLFRVTNEELYSWRRSLARASDEFVPPVVDVFGRGWKGEQISWNSFYPNRPFRCAVSGQCREGKHQLVSRYRFGVGVENFRGSLGYISEKIFDVLVAGSVPVYLGEERIEDYVPKSAFVDAREFRNQKELLLYLRSCSETEWRTRRESGKAYLQSKAFHPFSDEAFAARMIEVLRKLF
ncbi:MAG TPA: glycosyltransferase family 10 [Blastocatellia bacterium]|nr:glycosyltransferase family 10 [Blastocatellia bacterium]HMV85715.1 glycosyltransferase family 10 [Blastocatellia bacterium]HMY70944.1 glycosyltransferase family 10 [Blastocatellia bacterium]HMZ16410.1 glycosyltransferase family 10 [Blastocatellia bacterium]HNG31532.1 glycosyltransferase family 10 [Blastocatellia bacterium]